MENTIKNQKPILSYDESEISENEINYRMEENEEKQSREKIAESVYQDSFIYQEAWNDFKECLSEELNNLKTKYNQDMWKVKGKNMGWRHLEGVKTLKAINGEELLNGILPKTDCSLWVYKTKTQLIIKCSHHDAPMGEWYYIKPLSKKEVENENKY